MATLKQKTLKKEVVFSGKGLFKGQDSVVKLLPAPPGTGILFKRVDLKEHPEIPATLEYLSESARCTKIVKGSASIQTTEHLLSAISASEMDNLIVEVHGEEVPIFDGSSLSFIKGIEEAGVLEQEEARTIWKLTSPISWTKGDVHIVAIPSEEYRISYTLDYPHSPYLRSQYYSFGVNRESFFHEIAPCRTFALYEEIAPLMEKGILKGGVLENGVVIKGNEILNPGGARFKDEMVRHKILDIIGDLSLLGISFVAHIIAIKSGHAANHAFARQLKNSLQRCL